ncbi:YjiH family protein [Paenactinomyces guangxiensis]|uniref:YjiH family protein n=1 Tax=Paenactinomyces guangxiensis TaxID=1490290 RepID=A0A7W1WUB4_9BACL|nr:YjiH family protein [Paenactinomyces guangxiensis]MBA4496123.1 YjiH family protein [Paenactinomyces guangxiensis]MBH8593211.1 YjiH family protein [Paenactinomyces guangxiensis]
MKSPQTQTLPQTPPVMNYLKFIIPSLIGIILFMVPIEFEGKMTIPVALLANWLQEQLADFLPAIATGLMLVTVLFTLIAKWVRPAFIMDRPFFKNLFDVKPLWVVTRVLGSVFAVLTLFHWGPEWIWSENTGAMLLTSLIPVLITVFIFAGLFMPLLMDFGLLEMVGTLFTRLMRPLFTLPGRASIDCLASWLGDGTVGVLLTNKQYEDGFYTKREAAVIGTTFSVVSITFTIVVLEQVKLGHLFGPYYLTIALAGFAAAIILPRIPPLSRKADTNYDGSTGSLNETVPANTSIWKWGIQQAVDRANENRFSRLFINGMKNVLDMWIGVLPIVMALGTSAVIIAEYTPVFKWLGAPFVPLLSLLQIPEASEAAQTMVVGFADMFLPAVIGSGIIESEMTRFVIACVSVNQLIYMSEVGGLLLGSKVPVNFKDLLIIFLLRTLISLPIVALMAHLIF